MATLPANLKKKRAGVAGLAHHAQAELKSISRRDCRNEPASGISRILGNQPHGTLPCAAPQHFTLTAGAPSRSRHSRILRVRCPCGRFTPQLGERAVKTRSPFSGGELIHTAVLIAGAFAARRFKVSPISTMRDALPSVVIVSGRLL